MDRFQNNSRREFLKDGLNFSLRCFFAKHFLLQENLKNSPQDKLDLIQKINLKTNVEMEAMIHFYHTILGLRICEKSLNTCAFQAGNSVLKFTKIKVSSKTPFYHFAFNIPENKIRHAEEFQLKRTEIIIPPGRLQDSNYSENIVHFRHWDAHSLFFFDPAGNVVEYIARHTLNNSETGNFSSKDILNISEIGLVVDDVDVQFRAIKKQFALSKYQTSSDRFLAIGDEMGLIILFGKGSKAVFNRGRKREVFETEIEINYKKKILAWQSENYPFQIIS